MCLVLVLREGVVLARVVRWHHARARPVLVELVELRTDAVHLVPTVHDLLRQRLAAARRLHQLGDRASQEPEATPESIDAFPIGDSRRRACDRLPDFVHGRVLLGHEPVDAVLVLHSGEVRGAVGGRDRLGHGRTKGDRWPHYLCLPERIPDGFGDIVGRRGAGNRDVLCRVDTP